jgi:hypothetical protein
MNGDFGWINNPLLWQNDKHFLPFNAFLTPSERFEKSGITWPQCSTLALIQGTLRMDISCRLPLEVTIFARSYANKRQILVNGEPVKAQLEKLHHY